MNYIPLNELKNAWIFRHKSLPITEKDLTFIKPMTPARAQVLWDTFISKQVDHPDFFKKGDWPNNNENWQVHGKWEGIWDSKDPALPAIILEHIQWDPNTVVYYCSARNNVIETTWAIFQRCWKNFLFVDDGVILIGKKRQEAVQFLSNGQFKIGKRQ